MSEGRVAGVREGDAEFSIQPEAAALLVVDVQGRFDQIAHDAAGTVRRLTWLIDRVRRSAIPIAFTLQRFGALVPPLHPDITVRGDDKVIVKSNPDAFLDSDLNDWLTHRGTRLILLAGFATEACIDSTGRSALSHGYDLIVVADCHTTTTERATDPVGAAGVIAHHNATFARLDYAQRRVGVLPSSRLRFASARSVPEEGNEHLFRG